MRKNITKTIGFLLLTALLLQSCTLISEIKKAPETTETLVSSELTSGLEITSQQTSTADNTTLEDTTCAYTTSSPETTSGKTTTAETTTAKITTAETTTAETTASGTTSAEITSAETTAEVITPESTGSPNEPKTELSYDLAGLEFKTSSEYSFIADADELNVLFVQGGKEDKIYPASITKLVCALVALSYADTEQEFTVGSEMSLVARDASKAGLKKGDVITVDQLIYALLLPSGGDAAYTLAVNIGRIIAKDDSLTDSQAVSVFIAEMNKYAANIGMKNTVFESPDGYIEGEAGGTTLEDMMILGIYCAKEEILHKYTSCYEFVAELSSGRRLVLKNTNTFVNPSSSYYNPSVFGLKTGNNDKAGKCLIACARINGKLYVVGAFLAKSSVARISDIRSAFALLESFS